MTIDLYNGQVSFGKWSLGPQYSLNDIRKLFLPTEIELIRSNKNWLVFRLHIPEKYIISLYFVDEKIKLIIIDLFDINATEKSFSDILKDLGGVGNYSWGKIEFDNDLKSGFNSVVINYE